jgi:ABC-type multidrug transport system fused ATPase/permease subunit
MISSLFLSFAKDHPGLILLNVSMMVMVPINEVLLPFLYGRMINDITTSNAKKTLIIILLVLAFIQLGYIFRDKINAVFIPQFESFVKIRVLDQILANHTNNVSELTTGDIIYRLTRIPDVTMYWFQWMNDYIIPYSLVFISAIVYFLRFDVQIASAFVSFVCLLVIFSLVAPKKCISHAKHNDNVISEMHERIEDIVQNMPAIYSANTHSTEITSLQEHGQLYGNTYEKTASCSRTLRIITIPIVIALIAFFVMRSKKLIKSKAVSKQAFIPLFMILTSMLFSIFWLVDIMRISAFDLGVVSNMNDLLLPSYQTPRQEISMPPPNAILGLYNISYGFGSKQIFHNLSISFQEGKRHLIIGPVGTGKSTLFKILLGFLAPTSGDAFYRGKWYREQDIYNLRAQIGYVPQVPILFNNTVLYNITYGIETTDAVYTEIKRLLQIVKLPEDFLNRQVGKNGAQISGGQRQIVWCLRTLLKNPDVILLDEPTASLDLDSKNAITSLLNELMVHKTVIMITHDPFLTKHADITIDLQDRL